MKDEIGRWLCKHDLHKNNFFSLTWREFEFSDVVAGKITVVIDTYAECRRDGCKARMLVDRTRRTYTPGMPTV